MKDSIEWQKTKSPLGIDSVASEFTPLLPLDSIERHQSPAENHLGDCPGFNFPVLTNQGWISYCPVCRQVRQIDKPVTINAIAMEHVSKAYSALLRMEYAEAEVNFYQAARSCTANELNHRNTYLWMSLLSRYGLEYVSEIEYPNDPIRRKITYIPTFNRFPLPDYRIKEAKAFLEMTDSFEGFEEISELLWEIQDCLNEGETYDVFISWHDRNENDTCRTFAQMLNDYLHRKHIFSFASFAALNGTNVFHYEPHIYTALSSAKVLVIVIDDYDALGRKFLENEIRRFYHQKMKGSNRIIYFNGMSDHVGSPPSYMKGWQRHREDSTCTPDRVELVGRDIIEALSKITGKSIIPSRSKQNGVIPDKLDVLDNQKAGDRGIEKDNGSDRLSTQKSILLHKGFPELPSHENIVEVERQQHQLVDSDIQIGRAQTSKRTKAPVGKVLQRTPLVGEIISFGHYKQNSSIPEPIRWKVIQIKNNSALLLAETALEVLPYNSERKIVHWQESTLRKWLNGYFLHSAFIDSEISRLQRVAIPNIGMNKAKKAVAAEYDHVFILSASEVISLLPTNASRVGKATSYVQSKSAIIDPINNACRWWLRSSASYSMLAQYVDTDGSIDQSGTNIFRETLCVRPAVYLRIPL